MPAYRFWCLPDNPPQHPQALVAISYALTAQRQLTPPTRAVMDAAIALWRQHPQAGLICSTGDNQRLGVTNARVMAAYARDAGVPPERILEEDQSSNTYENLWYSWELAQQHGVRALTLVTYDLHTRRCVLTARYLNIPVTWVSARSATTGMAHRKPWFATRTSILLYEVLATVYSRLRGWL